MLLAAAIPGTSLAAQPFVIDGVALGGRFHAERDFRCRPVEGLLVRCQRKRQDSAGRGSFSATDLVLHRDGVPLYFSREVTPAYFSTSDIASEIKRLSTRFGERARVLRLPPREGLPSALMALWGKIDLELIEQGEALTAAAAARQATVIDYLGDPRRSAELGLPVFRLGGGAGFLWAARHDESGRGLLRFLTLDASQLHAAASPPSASELHAAAAPPSTSQRHAAASPPSASPSSAAPSFVAPPPQVAPPPPAAERAPARARQDEAAPPSVAAPLPVVDPERVGAVPSRAAEMAQTRSAPAGPAAASSVAALGVGALLGFFAALALVVLGLVLSRWQTVERARRQARYAALCRLSAAPATAAGRIGCEEARAPGVVRSSLATAFLLGLAVMIYVSSQSPAAVRGVLGYFGLAAGAAPR
jgi:hypothetical protein